MCLLQKRYVEHTTEQPLTRALIRASGWRQARVCNMASMRSMKTVIIGVLCASLVLGITASVADDDDSSRREREQDVIREALQRGEVLPLAKILAIAQQQVPGDIIEVELETERSALIYEIKVLTQSGRVREVKIDARSGAIVNIEDD